jgi:hypothetical protein
MIWAELLQFQSIIVERTAARLELDRVLIRGHLPERNQAAKTYVGRSIGASMNWKYETRLWAVGSKCRRQTIRFGHCSGQPGFHRGLPVCAKIGTYSQGNGKDL